MDINIRERLHVCATRFSLPYQTIYNQHYRHNSDLTMSAYVAVSPHMSRISTTLDSTLPYSAKRWETTVVTPSRMVTP